MVTYQFVHLTESKINSCLPSIFLHIFIIFFGYLDVNNYINNNPPSPFSLPFYFILIAPVKLDLKKEKRVVYVQTAHLSNRAYTQTLFTAS